MPSCAPKFGVNRKTPDTAPRQHIAGRKTDENVDAAREWLSPAGDVVLIGFLIKIVEPDVKRHLKERVSLILRDKLRDPKFSVGVNWAGR